MPKQLNLQNAVNEVATLRADQLGGLHSEVKDKLSELSLRPARRGLVADGPGPNANIRGMVDWVKSLMPPVDTCAIDKQEAEAAGKKYIENKQAKARYAKECERFDEEKIKLQVLAKSLASKMAAAGK